MWEVKTGKLQHDLVGHSYATAVAFSPDGHLLASAGRWATAHENGFGVILWNPHTGTLTRRIATTDNGVTGAVAFSPDGKLVAIGSQRFDQMRDTSTGAVCLAHVPSGVMRWLVTVPDWARPVAFFPDGKNVAVLCGRRSIRFLDVETGALNQETRPADPPRGGRLNDLAFATQAHVLVIGGRDKEQRGSVHLWDFGASTTLGPPAPSIKGRESTSKARATWKTWKETRPGGFVRPSVATTRNSGKPLTYPH